MGQNLPVSEELDFAYLLELMLPLYRDDELGWLPELFSIIGYERLLLLCKYAGGEIIKIPTLDQLADSVEAFQNFYDVYIAKTKPIIDVPVRLMPLFHKISQYYEVNNR